MFNKNEAVEAYYDDGWYPGIVFKVNEDGTFVIHFSDGDVADDIRPDEIRPLNNGNNNNQNNIDDFLVEDDEDIFGDEFKSTSKSSFDSFTLLSLIFF